MRRLYQHAVGLDLPRAPGTSRLLALEAVGRLGDPRLDDPRRSVSTWCGPFAGTVLFGDGRPFESPKPHPVELASLWLARHSTIVRDYGHFLDALPPEQRRAHQPPDRTEQSDHPTRPVVGVSWFDALAFCRWAIRPRWAPAT